MPRWRQTINPETGKSQFIPIDEVARRQSGAYLQGDIQSFVSPVDGSVISDRKQLREHNLRHGVVNSAEFSHAFNERKAKERERAAANDRKAVKRELYERLIRAERGEQ